MKDQNKKPVSPAKPDVRVIRALDIMIEAVLTEVRSTDEDKKADTSDKSPPASNVAKTRRPK